MSEATKQARDGIAEWFTKIERLKIKLALAVFLMAGIFGHFSAIYFTEDSLHLFALLEKTSDAIIIAAVIGITYEWYASRSRLNLLRREIEDIVRREEAEVVKKVNEVKGTLESIAETNTAPFSVIDPNQAEEELREKLEVCNQIKCMGQFSIDEEDDGEYTGNNLEKYIEKRIEHDEEDFELFRINPYQEENQSWQERHAELFKKANQTENSEYQLLAYSHSAQHPQPSFMIINDHNTPGGDVLVLAVHKREEMSDDFQHNVLLVTDDQKVIDAYEEYFDGIWNPYDSIDSHREIRQDNG